MVHVPYKGSGPAMTDLMAGQVNMMVETAPASLPFIKSGQLRALAVAAAERDLDAARRALGHRGRHARARRRLSTFGVLAPSQARPAAVVERLNAALAKMLEAPDVKEQFLKQGVYAAGADFAGQGRRAPAHRGIALGGGDYRCPDQIRWADRHRRFP